MLRPFFFRSFLNTCYNEFSYLVPIVKGVIGRKKGEKMQRKNPTPSPPAGVKVKGRKQKRLPEISRGRRGENKVSRGGKTKGRKDLIVRRWREPY